MSLPTDPCWNPQNYTSSLAFYAIGILCQIYGVNFKRLLGADWGWMKGQDMAAAQCCHNHHWTNLVLLWSTHTPNCGQNPTRSCSALCSWWHMTSGTCSSRSAVQAGGRTDMPINLAVHCFTTRIGLGIKLIKKEILGHPKDSFKVPQNSLLFRITG